MDAWLSQARDTLASASGIDKAQLEISDEAAATLLDLARIAAHNSGERTNAPLLCYLIGRAESAASLDDLDEALRGQI
jgi:Domain of unknown function (DUF6457)